MAMFGAQSSSGLFASARESSSFVLGNIGPTGSSNVLTPSAVTVDVGHAITAVSTSAGLRSSFVVCTGPRAVTVVSVRRPQDSASEQRAGLRSMRNGQTGGAFGSPSPTKLIVSPVATRTTAVDDIPNAVCVTPLHGSAATGRTAAAFDRSVVVTGNTHGTIEVYEASAPAADANAAPDLTLVQVLSLRTLQHAGLPSGSFVTAEMPQSEQRVISIAGASSATYGVSWIAVATPSSVLLFDGITLATGETRGCIAALDGTVDPFFAPSYSGSHIVHVAAVMPNTLSGDADRSSAPTSESEADDDRSVATTAGAYGRGASDNGEAVVPAFAVSWDDGTVHVIHAVLLPVHRGTQPVEFLATRTVEPTEWSPTGDLVAVSAAASAPLGRRRRRMQRTNAIGSVVVTHDGQCAIAVTTPNLNQNNADRDDDSERVATASITRVTGTTRGGAVVLFETLDSSGSRDTTPAMVLAHGPDLFLAKSDASLSRTAANAPLRPYRAIAAFASSIAAIAVIPAALPAISEGNTATSPSTPASRATSRVPSSAPVGRQNGVTGPIAVAAVDRELHFVLV
jgi:hypothetical protein